MQIIIVNGETATAQTVRSFLAQAKYEVRLCSRSGDVLAEAKRQPPALIFVEISLANRSLDHYRLIRASAPLANTPVILFSARAADEDRILALESGADDYIGQPFTSRELIARVQAVLRRFPYLQSKPDFAPDTFGIPACPRVLPPERITMGEIEIDTLAMRVSMRGTEIPTTSLEFRLMYYFAKHQYRVFSRDQLLDAVWGDKQFVTQRSVDACIRRIRRKIEPDRTRPTYLKTVRGAGYLLDIDIAARQMGSAPRLNDGIESTLGSSEALPFASIGFPLKEA